ncbi:MAG: hypothetical protein K6E16_00395 [Lachnospiraceae bacterium]|nr:hypothetical protein [Lachnospiraceae bacterium]
MGEVFRALVEQNGSREEKEIIREQTGFDGMTGQPVYSYRIANGFDGMTGQPLYVNVEQFEFDGMTGQPVYRIKGQSVFRKEALKQSALSLSSFDWKKYLPFFCIGGGVLVLAIILIVLIANGVFLSKRDKVALATYKTLNESTFGEMLLNYETLMESNQLTTTANVEGSVYGYGGEVNATIAKDSKAGKLSVNADVDMSGVLSQELNFYFDDSSVQLALPEINDEVYCYRYTSDNDGAVADLVYDYTEGSIDDVNTILQCANSMFKSNGDLLKKYKSKFKKAYKNIEVESIDSEEFEIDGKDRNCKGYEMHITAENVEDFVNAWSDTTTEVCGDDVEEILYAVASLIGDDDIVEEYKKMQDSSEMTRMISSEMDDIDLDFYLYGGKLAAIVFEYDNDVVSIEFNGGDTRCSNMTLTSSSKGNSYKDTIRIESSRNSGKEKGKIYFGKDEAASYSYDLKKGNFKVDVDGFSLDGVLLVKSNSLKFQTNITGFAYADIKLSMENDARISEPKGDKVDIGNIDEDELENTAYRLFRQLGDAADALEYMF